MHTAEHILNGTMVKMFGCRRSQNAHIERRKSKCDYDLPAPLSPEQVAAVEARVNEVIDSHLPVTMEYVTREEAMGRFDMERLPDNASDTLRVVRVGDYDECLCVGAHVANTAEIGGFRISSTRYEGGRFRIVFRLLTVILLALFASSPAMAQAPVPTEVTPLSGLQQVFKGKYHFVDQETGDTLCMIVFNPITIYPRERFRNKKEEQFYWRTVRDVRKTLPYAKLICSTLLETYEYLETFSTEKEKQEYLKQFEKEIFNQYKPVMKTFTRSQGKMLVKLINRETDQSSYNIVKAFLGTFRAGFWQTFGRFFGVNMKAGYHPEKNKDDAIIERICVRIETGQL